MIRVLHFDEQRELEETYLQEHCLTAYELMESVALKMAEQIDFLLQKNENLFSEIYVLVGAGSNGGDALALCNHLILKRRQRDLKVPPIVLFCLGKESSLCARQKEKLKKTDKKLKWLGFEELKNLKFSTNPAGKKILLIDGILGIGASSDTRPLANKFEVLKKIIQHRHRFYVVSLDLASGLLESGKRLNAFEGFDADLTLCVMGPKWAQLQGSGVQASGQIRVIAIDLKLPPKKALPRFLSRQDELRKVYLDFDLCFKTISRGGHKNSFPPILVVGGALRNGGASRLSAESVLRSGAGSVFLHEIPSQQKMGRAIFHSAREWISINSLNALGDSKIARFGTIIFGLGLPSYRDPLRKKCAREIQGVLLALRKNFKGTLIVDGGGLSFWAEDLLLKGPAKFKVLLTPHPLEALDLLKIFKAKKCSKLLIDDRNLLFSSLADLLSSLKLTNEDVLLLKGAYPMCADIGSTDRYVFNIASAKLATQGSGDVLAGVIGAFSNKLSANAHLNLGATMAALICQSYLLKFCKNRPVVIARDQIKLYAKLGLKLQRSLEAV